MTGTTRRAGLALRHVGSSRLPTAGWMLVPAATAISVCGVLATGNVFSLGDTWDAAQRLCAVATVIVVVAQLYRGQASRPRLTMAAGLAFYAVGQITAMATSGGESVTVSHLTDALLILSALLLGGSLLQRWRADASTAERVATAVDALTLTLLVATIVVLGWAPLAVGVGGHRGAVLVAYPIAYFGAAGVGLVSALHRGESPLRAGSAYEISLGLVVLGAAWTPSLTAGAAETPEGRGLQGLMSSLGILLTAWGALRWDPGRLTDHGAQLRSQQVMALLPIGVMIGGVGVLTGVELTVFHHPTEIVADQLVHLFAAGACLSAIFRQTLLLRDRAEAARVSAEARIQATRIVAERAAADARYREHVETFERLRMRMGLASTEHELVGAATAALRRLVFAPAGAVNLINPSRDRLVLTEAWGDQPATSNSATVGPGRCIGIQRGLPTTLDDALEADSFRCPADPSHARSSACVPMLAQGTSLGAVHLGRDEGPPFSADEVRLVAQVMEQVSLAIVNQRLVDSMQRQALTDPLTGVYNTRFWDPVVDRELAAAGRDGTPLGVIMFDLDRFKVFNDTYGHPAGDRALKAVAALVLGVLRASDTLARCGGEEFLVAVHHGDDATLADVAERMRQALENHVIDIGGGRSARVTASLGCASSLSFGRDRAALVAAADAALYAAKAAGRNQVHVAVSTGTAT